MLYISKTENALIVNSYNQEYQGISYWGEYFGINDLDIDVGIILGGRIINYTDLPPVVRSHVEWLLNNGEYLKKNIANYICGKIVVLLNGGGISVSTLANKLGVAISDIEEVYIGDSIFSWEQLKLIEKEFGIPCSTIIAEEYNRANALKGKISNLHKAIANKYKPLS